MGTGAEAALLPELLEGGEFVAGALGTEAAASGAAYAAGTEAATVGTGAAGVGASQATAGIGLSEAFAGLKTAATILSPVASLLQTASGISAAKRLPTGTPTLASPSPVTMPSFGDQGQMSVERRSIAEQLQRRGRASTILTADAGAGEKLGA